MEDEPLRLRRSLLRMRIGNEWVSDTPSYSKINLQFIFLYSIFAFMDNKLLRAKSVDLFQYLQSQGMKPVRKNSRKAYFISPKRSEGNPSFECDLVNNRWADYGEDHAYGDVIDYVVWMNGGTVGEAIDLILQEEKLPQYHKPSDFILKENNIDLIGEPEDITNEALIEYLERTRRIPLEVASEYCRQVTFQFASSRWANHFGIGMTNDLGGWSLRSVWFKGSTKPSGISTVVFDRGVNISLFEGMFDWLSYATLKGKPEETCVVLNSLVHIHMMTEHLRGYDRIRCYFDNDAAGDDKLEFLMANNYPVEDM